MTPDRPLQGNPPEFSSLLREALLFRVLPWPQPAEG